MEKIGYPLMEHLSNDNPETIPISFRIVKSYAMKWYIAFRVWWKVNGNWWVVYVYINFTCIYMLYILFIWPKFIELKTGQKQESRLWVHETLILKASVRYFLSKFYFFTIYSPSKTMKCFFFFSSKKLYSKFCDFFPSFLHFPDTKGQMEVE